VSQSEVLSLKKSKAVKTEGKVVEAGFESEDDEQPEANYSTYIEDAIPAGKKKTKNKKPLYISI